MAVAMSRLMSLLLQFLSISLSSHALWVSVWQSQSLPFFVCMSLSLPLPVFASVFLSLLAIPISVDEYQTASGNGERSRTDFRSLRFTATGGQPIHSQTQPFTQNILHPLRPPETTPNAIWAFGLGNSISTIEEERGSAFVCSSLDLIVALELILCFSVSFSASKSPSISPSLFLNLLICFCLSPFISLSAFRLLHHLSLVKSSSLHFC